MHAQTNHEGRLYTVRIYCDKDYPNRPPAVRFISRVNMTCVNQRNGEVDGRFGALAGWAAGKKSFEWLLQELRREMAAPHNRRLSQPPEGSNY